MASQPPSMLPDPTRPYPDRGYGFRYGTQQVPDTDPWAGTVPPNDLPYKGNGYYGLLPRKDNPSEKSSELSIGVEIGGKHYHVPSMVPGLNQQQLDYLLSTPEDRFYQQNPDMMRAIQGIAQKFAEQRISQGLPVFATASEEGKYTPNPSSLREAIARSIGAR